MMLPYVDLLQVGARNMQNIFFFARWEPWPSRTPQTRHVRDDRGTAMSAEYIMAAATTM